jgi:hypothetical protein
MMPAGPKQIEYATKTDLQDLRKDLAEFKLEITKQIAALETSLHKTIITTLIAMTAIFGTLVTILKLFA